MITRSHTRIHIPSTSHQMTDIFWGFEFWFVFFFKRIPWLLSTGNFVSLFLSHSGGVSEPLLYRIPFTGISFSFPEYLQSTQHEPFSVSYFKWCELWNNCEVMKEIVVYTTATQASDPPVLQKTTYMGWSKFPHLRTAFFFFWKPTLNGPAELHQPWLALFRVL